MRILWLINFEIPLIGNKDMVKEGWISGMLSAVLEFCPGNEIILLYPQSRMNGVESGDHNGFKSIGYYRNWKATEYNAGLKTVFTDIIKKIQPDILHVMGTEFPHSLSMCEACESIDMLDRLVISIQGMMKPYADAYDIGLPSSIRYGYRLKDIRDGNVNTEKKRFEKRAEYEIRALKVARNVIGRTEWDEMCTRRVNKNIKYYHNNEVLRPSFYVNEWKYENCVPNTVFVSQCDYPIKGLHILVEGAHVLKELGYDVKYRIAGWNVLDVPEWKMSKYVHYVYSLMRKYSLIEDFVFLNPLKEEAMVQEYLRANVFVLPSVIENSPNSLGEAMILGMPVVTADVGGVKDFVRHGEYGYVFPLSEPYMMAYYIGICLSELQSNNEIERKAKQKARLLYDRKINAERLASIYNEMMKTGFTEGNQ